MTGALFNRYVDDLPQHEAFRILTFAHATALPNAGAESWTAMIERSHPAPEAEETFFRYEGRPVRTPELIGALAERWGSGFRAEAE